MTPENKIAEMIESLANGNIGQFKRDVKNLKKLTLVKLMLAIEEESDTPYIQRIIIQALE